jgi:predicted Zn-dependent peptidase
VTAKHGGTSVSLGSRAQVGHDTDLHLQPPGTTWQLTTAADESEVVRTVLPSGLRVITESLPAMRSVSVGAWIDVGSRDETPSLAGATHFLEHMVFKGTRSRSAAEISQAIESRGGDLNAFTTKEYTCYHAQALDRDLDVAVGVVCDLVTSALVRGEDVETERPVVLEEIAMHSDDPTDAVHELIHQAMFGDTRLGRPVIGTTESVGALQRSQLLRWYRTRYGPERVVVAAAGNLRHEDVVRLASASFGAPEGMAGMASDTPHGQPARPRRPGGAGRTGVGRTILSERDTEQVTLAMAFPGVARDDPQRFTHSLLSVILGGGMSSRLFQAVREDRGLAYHVSAFQSRYAGTGMLGVQAGTSPDTVDVVHEVVSAVLREVAESGVTPAELERGKGQMRGSLVLGLEDTSSRMSRIATADLVHGRLMRIDEVLALIDAASLDDVNEIAANVLSRAPARAAVGRVPDGSVLRAR